MPVIGDKISAAGQTHLIFGPIPQGSLIGTLTTVQPPPPLTSGTYEPYLSSNATQDTQFSVGSTDLQLEVGPACPIYFLDRKELCINVRAPFNPTWVKLKAPAGIPVGSEVAGVLSYQHGTP